MAAGNNNAQLLEELLETFKQKDAIMEPAILQVLRKYVRAGGNPRNVVAALSDNYVGYAHMASLACEWIRHAAPAVTGPSAAAGTGSAPVTPHGVHPPGPLSAGGAGVLGLAGVGAGVDKGIADPESADEFAFLQHYAREKFDPKKFAGVFTRGGSGPPPWLDQLIEDKRGRQLIYELSAQHKSCLLLNFAIQKILHMGLEDEVACVGSSLAGYFGVFHRLLAGRLRAVATAKSEAELRGVLSDLRESAATAQHTYLHAQQILGRLAADPRGARFRRMAQELETSAAKLGGHAVWQMSPWLLSPDIPRTPSELSAASLVGALLQSEGKGKAFVSAVRGLADMYCCEHSQAPHVLHVRHPSVMQLLLKGLFGPVNPPAQDHAEAMEGVLAYAVAVVPPQADGAAADDKGVAVVRQALRGAAELARACTRGRPLTEAQTTEARACLAVPVAAHGVLLHLRTHCTDLGYYYELLGVAGLVGVLRALCEAHASLHEEVVSLVLACLQAMGNNKVDWAHAFLGVVVGLVMMGRVESVLSRADDFARSLDPSLMRHMLYEILAIAAPPYSSWFASRMLQLMRKCGVRRGREARNSTILQLLEEFGQAARDIQFDPCLNRADAAFLHELCSKPQYGV